ncbi:MAG: hypothetical protein GY851_35605 [bacterium]|nr:hypothetical protein [bacterium]
MTKKLLTIKGVFCASTFGRKVVGVPDGVRWRIRDRFPLDYPYIYIRTPEGVEQRLLQEVVGGALCPMSDLQGLVALNRRP